jgi:hypothetical protein
MPPRKEILDRWAEEDFRWHKSFRGRLSRFLRGIEIFLSRFCLSVVPYGHPPIIKANGTRWWPITFTIRWWHPGAWIGWFRVNFLGDRFNSGTYNPRNFRCRVLSTWATEEQESLCMTEGDFDD